MTLTWQKNLKYDPLPALSSSADPALVHFCRRDLLAEDPGPQAKLWEIPEVECTLRKQGTDGSWSYPARKRGHPGENYDLLETYRILGYLIERWGMDRSHPAVARAADYLLAHQTPEGDIRGIFGSQYAPHYTAGMLELLIKAGYSADPRIDLAFQWFEDTRQDDGGWAWPLRTAGVSYQAAIASDHPVQTDPARPFSHALTMFIIRAYAAHQRYRKSLTALKAGELLLGRFFQADSYADRRDAEYWFKFQHPFWWGNLLTALDSLSLLGFTADHLAIRQGLDWFTAAQGENGLWPTGYSSGKQADQDQAWVGLAICRVLQRLEG